MTKQVYETANVTVSIEDQGASITYEDKRPNPETQDEFISRALEYQSILKDIHDGIILPVDPPNIY